ncbi:MAG TPA: YsnF/AvaK domain-containing protein [Terriglobales bacterium]|nr:YsnF/AvaK domain-containing protein [Terriglobales bacterium]
MDVNTSQTADTPKYVVGFFRNYADAENAIHDLTEAGIPSNRISLAVSDDPEASSPSQESESFWRKIANFFEGKDHIETSAAGASSPELHYGKTLKDGGVLVSVSTLNAEERQECEDIFEAYEAELEDDDLEQSAKPDGDGAGQRLQLLSEVLRVHKERVPTGEVRLRKEVVTENQSIEVPVTREELVIERRPAEGAAVASSEIGSDREIRIPLSEEQVRVEKRPVVKEEVKVGKKKVQESRQVNEQVKREELRVDQEGDVQLDRKKGIA